MPDTDIQQPRTLAELLKPRQVARPARNQALLPHDREAFLRSADALLENLLLRLRRFANGSTRRARLMRSTHHRPIAPRHYRRP